MNNNFTKFQGKEYTMTIDNNGVITLTPKLAGEKLLKKKRSWAHEVLDEYSGCYLFVREGSKVVALQKDSWNDGRFGEVWGMAVCNERDEFDDSIGRALAVCRAEGDDIPDFMYM